MKTICEKGPYFVRLLSIFLCSVSFVAPLYADVHMLEEVKVEGEAPEDAPLETPVFERRQERFLSQAVEGNTSLTLATQGSPLQNTFAYVRGVPSQGTTLLEDGVCVNTQSELGRASLGPFVMLDMGEVSVIPGAEAEKGVHPLGGTLSMRMKRGQGKPKFSSLFERGSLRTTTLHESVGGAHDKGDFYVAGTLQKTGLGTRVNKLHGNRVADEGALQRMSTNVGVKVGGDMTLRVLGHLTSTQNALDDTPFGAFPVTAEGREMLLTRSSLQTSLVRHEDARDEGGVRAFLVTYDGIFEGETPFKTRTRTVGLNLWQKKQLTKAWRGWGGYDLAFDALRQRRTLQEERSEAVHTLTLGTAYESAYLIPDAEVKLYRAKGSSVEASYAFGARAPVTSTTELFAKYGRGIKRPLLMEKYGAQDAFQIANPELTSQFAHTGSVGVRQSAFDKTLTLECALFSGILTNLMQHVQVAPLVYQTRNQGNRRFEGIESKVRFAPNDALNLSVFHTLTRVRVGSDQLLPTHIPRHHICVDVEGKPHADVTLFAQYQFQTSRTNYDFRFFPSPPVRLSAFGTLRLGASWDLNESISAFARVENVGGAEYETNYGYGARGRTFLVGGRLTL